MSKTMEKKRYCELVRKSALAAVLIGLGDYVLLKIGEPVGPVLFGLGLMGVCALGANLFTGKAGFLIEKEEIKVKKKKRLLEKARTLKEKVRGDVTKTVVVKPAVRFADLMVILVVNLVVGYLVGLCFSVMDGAVVTAAEAKVATWSFSLSYFLKSVWCGVVMYVAVKMYKQGSVWGVLLGVPLFLFCGWQHSIANVITLGVARGFSWLVLFCAGGNFCGSIVVSFLAQGGKS